MNLDIHRDGREEGKRLERGRIKNTKQKVSPIVVKRL